MKKQLTYFCLLSTTALSVVSCGGTSSKQNGPNNKKAKKPNILFIMSDDHASTAISCYGSKLIKTPNIDRIANEGIRFDNYCVSNAISGPSRAILISGKMSHLNGKLDNSQTFDGSQSTYPKVLHKNGYQTSVFGKWHLRSYPTGFDYWSILPDQGDYYNPNFIEMGDTITEKGYVTDIITNKAIHWLENRDKSKPFAMIYQHKAPHRNWMPSQEHMGMFEDKTFPIPDNFDDDYNTRGTAARTQEMEISNYMREIWDLKLASKKELDDYAAGKLKVDMKDPKQKKHYQDLAFFYHAYSRMTPKEREVWHKTYDKRIAYLKKHKLTGKALAEWKYQCYMRDYLAVVVSLDENIGRMLDYLEKTGELDNTIIVYTADQGFFLGEHGWFDKRFMYNESQKAPFVIRYPKAIKAGTHSDAFTTNVDVSATFLDYAGCKMPSDMQGESWRPIFENNGKTPKDWRQSVYYHYYEYPAEHAVKRHYGIRTKDYALIHYYNDVDEWELFDETKDPKEMNNVYTNPKYKSVVKDLKYQLDSLRTYYKDTTGMSVYKNK